MAAPQTPILGTVSVPKPKRRHQFRRPPIALSFLCYNLEAPNLIRPPQSRPALSLAQNAGMMAVRESMGQRVNMRCDFEISVNWGGIRSYRRLRACSIQVSSPNAAQAELFISALHDFCASLDGKWLAPKPLEASDDQASANSSRLAQD